MDATFSRGRRVARETTPPIRNVPMAALVGMGDFDDVPTVEFTAHEREAMAALSRFRAMRERTRNAMAWRALAVRLADARLQLTFGMTREEALATPMVSDLLFAEEIANGILRGIRAPTYAPRRCEDVMRSERGGRVVSHATAEYRAALTACTCGRNDKHIIAVRDTCDGASIALWCDGDVTRGPSRMGERLRGIPRSRFSAQARASAVRLIADSVPLFDLVEVPRLIVEAIRTFRYSWRSSDDQRVAAVRAAAKAEEAS